MTKREEKRNLESIPVGSLGVIALEGCKTLGEKVDYLLEMRASGRDKVEDYAKKYPNAIQYKVRC